MINVVLFLAVLVAAAWIAWRRGARVIAAVIALFALLPTMTLLRELPWPAYLVLVAALVGFGWHRHARSAGVVTRWSAGNRRRSGVASTLDIARTASAMAMRRRATTVRPSLAELTPWELQRLPVREVGLQLCRSGVTNVYASHEDVVMMVSGSNVIVESIAPSPTALNTYTGPRSARSGPQIVSRSVRVDVATAAPGKSSSIEAISPVLPVRGPPTIITTSSCEA